MRQCITRAYDWLSRTLKASATGRKIGFGDARRNIISKVWPEYFEPVSSGAKTFEIRVNDRHYRVGDILILKEWCPKRRDYTGRQLTKKVTYLFEGGSLGLNSGMVILAFGNNPQER